MDAENELRLKEITYGGRENPAKLLVRATMDAENELPLKEITYGGRKNPTKLLVRVNMDAENELPLKEITYGGRKNPAKLLVRFPPSGTEKPPVKTDCEPFDFDVHEKIQFFEKRNKAVESVKKSIADYVNRSIEGLLKEYSSRETTTSNSDNLIKQFLMTGTVASATGAEPRINESELEILYRDLKENRSNKLLSKFVRTLAYKVKQKTDCSKEDLESIGPVINDVILGILAKKMLSHKIEQLLGFQNDLRRFNNEDRGEEVFTVNDYKVKIGWKIAKKPGVQAKNQSDASTDTNDAGTGQETLSRRQDMSSKRKRRRSRRKKSAAARWINEPKKLVQENGQEEIQESIKELLERKFMSFDQNDSLRIDGDSELTSTPQGGTEQSSGSSYCNLMFMDALDTSAIKMEEREIAKINRASQRKTGKMDRKGKRIKLKGSPIVTKWEKQLMSSSSPEESHDPSSPLYQSVCLLRQNELKERKGERSRKKRENFDSQTGVEEDEGVTPGSW